jgi:hypothetical protein
VRIHAGWFAEIETMKVLNRKTSFNDGLHDRSPEITGSWTGNVAVETVSFMIFVHVDRENETPVMIRRDDSARFGRRSAVAETPIDVGVIGVASCPRDIAVRIRTRPYPVRKRSIEQAALERRDDGPRTRGLIAMDAGDQGDRWRARLAEVPHLQGPRTLVCDFAYREPDRAAQTAKTLLDG